MVLEDLVGGPELVTGVAPGEDSFEELYFDHERAVTAVTAVFMVAFVLGNFLHTFHITCIPESFVVILLGGALGWIMQNSTVVDSVTLEQETILNRSILSLALLPIIIFEAGWSLKHRDFVAQLPYILIFAVFGTCISMGVVAGLILWTSNIHGIYQPRIALAYGALISAVDPVATLSTYAHLQVEPLLNVLVLGESIVNDAVAIVLFETLNNPPAHEFRDKSVGGVVLDISGGVLGLMSGSAGLGLCMGTVYILIMRFARLRHSPALQILFVTTSTFFTYAVTEEVFKMSPIIVVLFASMLMSAYATPHLGLEGNLLCSFMLKQLASVADMAVFLFVGIAIVFQTRAGWKFGLLMIPFCLLGRAVAVVPLGILSNGIKATVGKKLQREQMLLLSPKHLFMMWHAGLRGGIALVLTLQMGDWVDEINGPGTKAVLRNATLVIICSFLLVFGGSTELFLRLLKVPMGGTSEMYHHHGRFYKATQWLHHKVLHKILVGSAVAQFRMEGGVISSLLRKVEMVRNGHHPEGGVVMTQSTLQIHQQACETFDLFGNMNPTRERVRSELSASEEEDEDASDEHAHDERWLAVHDAEAGSGSEQD